MQRESRFALAHALTQRESAVLSLVSEGHSVHAIADELYITEHSVRNHLVSAYCKLKIAAADRSPAQMQPEATGTIVDAVIALPGREPDEGGGRRSTSAPDREAVADRWGRTRRGLRSEELIERGRIARERSEEISSRIDLALRRARIHERRLLAIKL